MSRTNDCAARQSAPRHATPDASRAPSRNSERPENRADDDPPPARNDEPPVDRELDATPTTEDLESLVARRLQHIRLAQRFAEIGNEADSLDIGVALALRTFGRRLDWDLGHAYLSEAGGDLVDSGLWWMRDGLDAAAFVAGTERSPIQPGADLPGLVATTRSAHWVDDDVADHLRQREAVAREVGLRSAIAFPIVVRSRVAGVLEFYGTRARSRQHDLLETVPQLAAQLGRVIERMEFERELARLAQEEKRNLGRELHDTLSQQLTGVGMLARSLQRKLEEEAHAQADRSRALLDSIKEARRQLRAIARGLNPSHVSTENIRDALTEFAADTQDAFDVPCRVHDTDQLDVDDDFTATQVYYIVREAVHNAAKHGHAKEIRIDASTAANGTIAVTVRDDGAGFDPAVTHGTGMGLRTLRYRARLIRAHIEVESSPGSGTTVRCVLRRKVDA